MVREQITTILAEAQATHTPSRTLLDRLVPLVYQELRQVARAHLAREGQQLTLDTTGLVHEAYLRLVDGGRVPLDSRGHFFGAAARAMRQVLVDAARRRQADKRGGGIIALNLDAVDVGIDATADEVVVVDDLLDRLGISHPRPAQVFECRYFGGLEVAEIAAVLGIAPRTVNRDLLFAQAWLRRALSQPPAAAP